MDSLGTMLLAQSAEGGGMAWGQFGAFSILHFLEFAIWGSWYVVLGNYLNAQGFSRTTIGRIYGTMPIGAIISPMIIGTIADKYVNTELILAVSHLIGAVLLFVMSQMRSATSFFIAALAYALVYAPTMSLVNAIVFSHIGDSSNFPYIRVFGTIGWIAAGMSLKVLLKPDQPVSNRPLILASSLSLILGLFCFLLPTTPPPEEESLRPYLDAISLASEPTFAIFLLVTLIISMAMAFYFSFGALFLEQGAKVKSQNVGPYMTLGQWVEIIFMLALPWIINRLGMPFVLSLGVTAWAVRFAFFSYGKSFALIVAGVALHGLCFDFFFVAGFTYVENTARKAMGQAITASAQTLYGVIVYGLGMYLGAEAAGWLNNRFTTETAPATEGAHPERTTDWRRFWLVPCVAISISLVLYVISTFVFPEPTEETGADEAAPAVEIQDTAAEGEEAAPAPVGDVEEDAETP